MFKSKSNFVKQEVAVNAAKQFANRYGFSFNKLMHDEAVKKKRAVKEVHHARSVNESEKEEAMYFINYSGGGFVIISADKRVNPVLAYSENNRLPLKDDKKIPDGLSLWIKKSTREINKLRSNKAHRKTADKDNKHPGWNIILKSEESDYVKSNIPIPDEDPCTRSNEDVGPLLQTNWGQADGYNNDAPYKSCNYPSNGRAYSGCVATAMAQVMRYHTYPNDYNWGIMPDVSTNSNSSGSDEISELVSNVGDAVNMDYGCDASGAKDDDIEPGFRSLGYASATQIGYAGTNNYEDVINDLEQDNPVVFTGYKNTYLGFIDKDGHAWVGDGYSSVTICPSGNSYLHFHMNWGWEGSYNGWFGLNNFDPGNSQYNSGTEVVVNIHP